MSRDSGDLTRAAGEVHVPGRILRVVTTLIIVGIAIFLLIHLVPGDPATVRFGDRGTAETIARTKEMLGLDRSLPAQFGSFVVQLLHGDLSATPSPGACRSAGWSRNVCR